MQFFNWRLRGGGNVGHARVSFSLTSSLTFARYSFMAPAASRQQTSLQQSIVLELTLPIEIFEAIIDQTNDHAESLRQLSLTCKTFLPRSRYHLFSSICIRTVHQMETSREFLDCSPWVIDLVQKITLSVEVDDDGSTLTNPNIRVLDVVPIHLLSRLPNLRALKLRPVHKATSQVSLSLHRYTLSSYKRHGGRIKHLELKFVPFNDVSDFIGLVSAFESLESLVCEYLRFRTPRARRAPPDESNTVAGSLKLKRLHVSTYVLPLSGYK